MFAFWFVREFKRLQRHNLAPRRLLIHWCCVRCLCTMQCSWKLRPLAWNQHPEQMPHRTTSAVPGWPCECELEHNSLLFASTSSQQWTQVISACKNELICCFSNKCAHLHYSLCDSWWKYIIVQQSSLQRRKVTAHNQYVSHGMFQKIYNQSTSASPAAY